MTDLDKLKSVVTSPFIANFINLSLSSPGHRFVY